MTLAASDGTVLLAVRDGSTSVPVRAVPQMMDMRGRGLLLVERVGCQHRRGLLQIGLGVLHHTHLAGAGACVDVTRFDASSSNLTRKWARLMTKSRSQSI